MKLLLAFILFITVSSCQQRQNESLPELSFFALYHQNDAAQYEAPDVLQLNLRVNVHELDCGAPDCYGHDMIVRMKIVQDPSGCRIVEATSLNTTRTCSFEGADSLVAGIHPTNRFLPVGNPDLRNSGLTEIIFHDSTNNQALILLPGIYYFYEDELPTGLEQEWTEENFPATSSEVRRWGLEKEN